jgi:hypothetical protein
MVTICTYCTRAFASRSIIAVKRACRAVGIASAETQEHLKVGVTSGVIVDPLPEKPGLWRCQLLEGGGGLAAFQG